MDQNNENYRTWDINNIIPSSLDGLENKYPTLFYQRTLSPTGISFRLLGKPLFCESYYLPSYLKLGVDLDGKNSFGELKLALKEVFKSPIDKHFENLELLLSQKEQTLFFQDIAAFNNYGSSGQAGFDQLQDILGVGSKPVGKSYKNCKNKKEQISQFIRDLRAVINKPSKVYLWSATITSLSNTRTPIIPSLYQDLDDPEFGRSSPSLASSVNGKYSIEIIKINNNKFHTISSFLEDNSMKDLSGFNARDLHFSDYKSGQYTIANEKTWLDKEKMIYILKNGIWDLNKSLKHINNKSLNAFKGFFFKPISNCFMKSEPLKEEYFDYEREQQILSLKNKINSINFKKSEVCIEKEYANSIVDI